ncbi:uncharacterized protein [Physcomitrium patens]|uniref:uncharacterized protein isoform X3 n=1 Tax=Physcomitrium patens TaxID=3218 RepID=UPI003CCDE08B
MKKEAAICIREVWSWIAEGIHHWLGNQVLFVEKVVGWLKSELRKYCTVLRIARLIISFSSLKSGIRRHGLLSGLLLKRGNHRLLGFD